MTQELVLPTELPMKALKRKDLEECVYWLLDGLGAKNLEWRLGGTGDGAADQGRDLEAEFYAPAPDGEMVRQRWWIEAKGRAKTVEMSSVKNAVVNVQARTDVDVLVIATNTTFSNQTRDWVLSWQRTNARPIVRLKLPGFRGHFPLCGEGSTNGQETSSCLPVGVPG